MIDYERWINRAISKTGGIKEGSFFVLKDLFDGIEWNELENGEKRELGRRFKYLVKNKMVPYVDYNDKAPNNSARYRKKEQL